MAYNTRRSGEAINNVGQRRNQPPGISNNFVSGGQLSGQNRPFQQQPQGQALRPNNPTGNFRQMAPPQQQPPQLQQPQQVPPQINPQMQMKSPAPSKPELAKPKQDVPIVQLQQIPPAKIESFQGETTDPNSEEAKKKPLWLANLKGATTKISRKERQRRRNVRLSRILQPKNAVMILNELISDIQYQLSDGPQTSGGTQYLATITFDGVNHMGYGHNKMEAKNNAAEQALKYVVKNKKFPPEVKEETDGDVKMDCEDGDEQPLPWQHVASFALYKLLNSWGEDPFRKTGLAVKEEVTNLPNRPSKKMPENASHMNPIMLLNQVMPQAQFEEVGQSGHPPHINFNYSCTLDGQTFTGSGPNKKTAKKMAAYAVCNLKLGLQYPPEIYTPI